MTRKRTTSTTARAAIQALRDRLNAAIESGAFVAGTRPCRMCNGTGAMKASVDTTVADAIGTSHVAVAAFRNGTRSLDLGTAFDLMALLDEQP